MKCVALIPIKKTSSRVKRKNFKKIGEKKLYEFFIDKVKKCGFDEIYVDSDSNEVKKYCNNKKINFIKRKKSLSKNSANGNDLLNYHYKIIKADYYFQLFITAPLLSIKTIKNCISLLKKTKNYDSILTSHEIYSWFWFNKKPINYKPQFLPRSQDAKPIIVETTGLYGIKAQALKHCKCRIGRKPYFYNVNKRESLDLDTNEDFDILRAYLNH
tara:strand:- start:293 stop:934 length:642 start_codon:yes stop_codon:yes gene_type:complete